MNDMKKRYFNKGFTFIEAMVAILVLTLGLTAILQVFPVALGRERLSQMRSQAVFLAQAKVEQLSFQGYENIGVGDFSEPSLLSPFEDFSRQTKIRYVDAALNEVGADQGLKKIEVRVWWQGALFYPEKEVEITTLLAKK